MLDTDLGTDDACALLLIKNLPKKPDYLVASFGNTNLDGACENAVVLKKYLGLDYQTVRGSEPPESSKLLLDEKGTFHGKDGLANCRCRMKQFLEITSKELNDVISFEDFVDEVLSIDKITYITTGTVSNLAKLIKIDGFRDKLQKAYVMGGGLEEFNCKNDTEFNFSKDPKSVKEILSLGLNLTLFTLDVTNHQYITKEQIDVLEETKKYSYYINFLRHNLKANTDYNNITGAVLHDALPVIYFSCPDLFSIEEKYVDSDKFGHTFLSNKGTKIHVCTDFQKGKLFELVKSSFESD